MAEAEIKGSTTIVELLKRYPDGRAARLMAELNWACAHCGGAFHEPLTMAAKRHARDPRAELPGKRPNLFLADAGLEQRMVDTVLGGRPESRPPVADVVRVGAREHRRIALAAGEREQSVVELRLAVVAALLVVAPVSLARE